MRINTQTRDVQYSSNVKESQQFTFDVGGQTVRNLAISIYTRPMTAVTRELVANARDAHVEAQTAKPIELVIKDKSFWLRDYGKGLSKEFLLNDYCKIGRSTKNDTDEQVGAFGIGRASVFTLTDQMFLTSFQSGKMLSCIVAVAADGGIELTLVSEEDTNQPDGLLISFISEEKFDESTFNYIDHLDVPIDVKYNDKKYTLSNATLLLEGDNYKIYENHRSVVVMGGISYPYRKLAAGLVLTVPIGSIDIVSSRDAIQNNERSIETIKAAHTAAIASAKTKFEEQISKCEHSWEAFPLVIAAENKLKQPVTWNGVHLSRRADVKHQLFLGNLRAERCSAEHRSRIDTGNQSDNRYFLYGDIKYSPRQLARYLCFDVHRHSYKISSTWSWAPRITKIVYLSQDLGTLEEVAEKICVSPDYIYKASEIKEAAQAWQRSRRTSNSNTRSNNKNSIDSAKQFSYTGSFKNSYIKNELTPTSKLETYLLCMDHYELNYHLRIKAEILHKCGVTFPDYSVVRYTRYHDLIKLSSHKSLSNWIDDKLKDLQTKNAYQIKRCNIWLNNASEFKALLEMDLPRVNHILERLKNSVTPANTALSHYEKNTKIVRGDVVDHVLQCCDRASSTTRKEIEALYRGLYECKEK